MANGEMTLEEALKMADEGLADVDEACRMLGQCSRDFLYALTNDGKLPFVEIPGSKGRKIPRVALKAYVAQHIETASRTPPKGRKAAKS